MSPTSISMPPTLQVRNVRLAAGARVLVEGLSFDLVPGQVLCVLGRNGSGKTTLLHTLAGLLPPQAGTVAFQGRDWSAWGAREAARRRGLLLQHASYAFSASVAATVMLGRHPHIGRFGSAGESDRRCAAQALAAMDLEALAGRDVLSLSGGERQRTAIATLLAQDPALLLLDEPTAHLDLVHQIALFRHLEALARTQARAVVVTTHDCNLAARFATHACLLHADGRTVTGRAAEVLQVDVLSALFDVPLTRLSAGERAVLVPQW